MARTVLLKAKGLFTNPNNLGSVPEGALSVADNINIDRQDIAEPRRGIALYGELGASSITDKAKQLLSYKTRLIAHYASKLAFDDGAGDFTDFNGSYSEVEAGTKIKSVEANGNLYFTTSEGIKKISATSASSLVSTSGFITQAGGVKALDLRSVLHNEAGFMTQNSQVAYRIVWGIKDVNNNLILGTPSERVVVSNPIEDLLVSDFNKALAKLDIDAGVTDTNYYSTLKLAYGISATAIYNGLLALATKLDADGGVSDTNYVAAIGSTSSDPEVVQGKFDIIINKLNADGGVSATDFDLATTSQQVKLFITVPSGVTTANFYQVYRTALSQTSDTDPGDEQQLVYEANPTSTEISAAQVIVIDITPDSFRGADLYTNPSQETILQANEVPPLAKDVASYKNSVFYANTQTKHRLSLDLLGLDGLTSGSKLLLTDGTNTVTISFATGVAEVTTVQCTAGTLLSGTYFTLNSANDLNQYYVWYNTGASVDPAVAGREGIEISIGAADAASVVASKTLAVLAGYADFSITILTDTLTITNAEAGITTNATSATSLFTVTVTTPGAGENVSTGTVLISSLSTAAQSVDETARSLVRVLNRYSSSFINAFYLSGPDDVPGKISLEARTLGSSKFYIVANSSNTGESFSPDLSPTLTITAISMANPTVISAATHGMASGAQVVIGGSDSTPTVNGLRTITSLSAGTFSIPVNVTVAGTTGFAIPASTAVASDNDQVGNRVYYSKFGQPEAVPLLNYVDVGARDQTIKRILALRDSLFIIKTDGVYRITGEDVGSLSVILFDNSTRILAAESACVGNNQIYMYSDQGVATISDTGVGVISVPIDNRLLPLTQYTGFDTKTFGLFYETERKYILFVPSISTDSVATQAFVFNTFTQAWTRWLISHTCGIVNQSNNRLFLGAADTNYIERERKSYTIRDQADRELDRSVISQTGLDVKLNSTTNISIGDVIAQIQYVTAGQFNRTLRKLDVDPGVGETDYLSTLAVANAAEIPAALMALAVKLDNDPGVTLTNYAALVGTPLTPVATQTSYNALIGNLNVDPGVSFTNYALSSTSYSSESTIVDIDRITNTATIAIGVTFFPAACTVYKAIPTVLQWVPQHAGDPAAFKHFREAETLFSEYTFTGASMSFSSDLESSFEEVEFEGGSTGAWGLFAWGNVVWGGDVISQAFRTYIPLGKGRCRLLNPKFAHSIALEKFALTGLSLALSEHKIPERVRK